MKQRDTTKSLVALFTRGQGFSLTIIFGLLALAGYFYSNVLMRSGAPLPVLAGELERHDVRPAIGNASDPNVDASGEGAPAEVGLVSESVAETAGQRPDARLVKALAVAISGENTDSMGMQPQVPTAASLDPKLVAALGAIIKQAPATAAVAPSKVQVPGQGAATALSGTDARLVQAPQGYQPRYGQPIYAPYGGFRGAYPMPRYVPVYPATTWYR